MFNLKGKVAVITGSRRGIGKGIAEALAEQGANIVISDIKQKDCDKTAKNIAKRYNVRAIGIECNVSSRDDVNKLMDAAVKKLKKIDILVNNAGIFVQKPMKELSEEDWDKIIDVNLKGVFLCTKAASKRMKKGKIINIASIAGLVGYLNAPAYCASKGGVVNMTRENALELAPKINVNAIAPGVIDTPMTDFLKKDKKLLRQTLAGVPLGNVGKPKDIGRLAVYLASAESDYVTGQTIAVDGGWTIQ
ncbi:glucose 1-dehydrogenase [Candidatus Woesearchaeota archaeon]|nr:glucose 1-dehydrogenase [Candidatus Woesearchaeota archaeon]